MKRVVRSGAGVARWMLRFLAASLWMVASGTLAAWVVSRVLTDRYEWSQFLYWIPSRLSLLGAGAALALAWIVYAGWMGIARRREAARERGEGADGAASSGMNSALRGRMARTLLWTTTLALLAGVAYAGIVEWRWHALPGVLGDRGTPRVRVAFWNFGGWEQTGWVDLAKARDADLLVFASPSGSRTRKEFEELADERTAIYSIERFLVATRWRMIERGWTALGIEAGIGIDPRAPGGVRQKTDPGMAAYMVFEDPLRPGEADARLVVWLVDLPSDPSLHRMAVTSEARRAIETWRGVVQKRIDEDSDSAEGEKDAARRLRGEWVSIHPDDRAGAGLAASGFPAPDVIMGDFNIPRGSVSLLELTAGLTNVYEMAGTGGMATFPRTVDYTGIDRAWLRRAVDMAGVPLVHIDQMFVRSPLRAVRYEVLDLGMCSHLMQVCDLER